MVLKTVLTIWRITNIDDDFEAKAIAQVGDGVVCFIAHPLHKLSFGVIASVFSYAKQVGC